MKEEAVLFGQARSLVGIITDPAESQERNRFPAVMLLNSGIVHRVGLNRLHVKIARDLARKGFVVMRFDFSGIGDSQAREDSLPFQKSAVSETQEAMSYLVATRGVERFVVIGICSGAAISLNTAFCDSRVAGVIAVNNRFYLQGLDEQSSTALKNRALARHYWRIAFSSSFSAKNWLKAVTGKVNYRSLATVLALRCRSLFAPGEKKYSGADSFMTGLRLLAERAVRVLLIHCEGDEGLDYLHEILGHEEQKESASRLFELEIIPGANHTFTPLWSQDLLRQLVRDWLQQIVQEGVCS